MAAELTRAEKTALATAYREGEVSVLGTEREMKKSGIQSLLDRGYLKMAPRGASPFHDNFKLTQAGRRAAKEQAEGN
jgi:hypothetical protein